MAWIRRVHTASDGAAVQIAEPPILPVGAQRIKNPEEKNRELRRANQILKSTSAVFAAELDRPSK